MATADVSYTANVTGDDEVTLADPRFSYSQLISGNTTKTFPETFTCPTNRAAYDANYMLTKTFTNTATLKGVNGTNKTASADVTLKCRYPWQSETATGAGTRYKNAPNSNWFIYTPYTTTKVNLIAGQKYDAGDIYMTRDATNTYIKITLHNGFRWANMSQNLKIQPFASATPSYLQPGSFQYKFTVTPQSTVTYTATIPSITAKTYGIHADVERFVN